MPNKKLLKTGDPVFFVLIGVYNFLGNGQILRNASINNLLINTGIEG